MQHLKQANDLSITERIQRLRMLMAQEQETSDHAQELRESTSEQEARLTSESVPSIEQKFWNTFTNKIVIPRHD